MDHGYCSGDDCIGCWDYDVDGIYCIETFWVFGKSDHGICWIPFGQSVIL